MKRPGSRAGSSRRRRKAPAPLRLSRLRTYPLASRESKVDVSCFAAPYAQGASVVELLDGLPRILAGQTLRALSRDVVAAFRRGKPIIWGIGAHVLKVGLAPVLIDLVERGLITGLAMNGAGIVHDFELAVVGHTSEEVAAGLDSGRFGMARETGRDLNRAIVEGDRDGLGIGAAVGRHIVARRAAYADQSVLAACHRTEVPATVHVALGTDIIHMHPACDPAAVGRASHLDFRLFAAQVARLGGGGVYLNVGSAVVLPEVFLKAVTLARNLGHELVDFSTANLDFIQSYRPTTNVVSRPTQGAGRGYSLTGHHEIMVPLLAAALVEGLARWPARVPVKPRGRSRA